MVKNKHQFNPKVSIVIPVYNGENYLSSAINSAINQTYSNIEILVINDGSTDKTKEIATSYGNKIKYFEKTNGGVSSALNLAIKNMTGDYFSWLSHDDLYYKDKIEKQIAYLSRLKEKNVVLYSNYILIDEDGKQIGKKVLLNHKMLERKPEYALLRGCINGITLLIPQKIFKDVGLFDETLRVTQDYDLWHRILKKYRFIHMKDVLAKTRIHSQQDTVKNPCVITEGDKLWIYMIEDISDKRKTQLEKSIFDYYYEQSKYLKISQYKNARNHCLNMCQKINPQKTQKLLKIESKKSKCVLYKLSYALKYHGVRGTIKAIKKIIHNKGK